MRRGEINLRNGFKQMTEVLSLKNAPKNINMHHIRITYQSPQTAY